MEYFFIRQNNVLKRIPFEALLWVKAEGNYSIIHTTNKRYVLKISLKRVLEQLPSDSFAQIHRAHIVALSKIEEIDTPNYELSIGGYKLPIGRNYKDELLTKLIIIK